jgi:hypothetical protein
MIMNPSRNFPNGLVQPLVRTTVRPRLSLTADILSFRKCRRQYGYFGNDGFVPAKAVQMYFGQVIHQVLDRCHRHFAGLFGTPVHTMPDDADIDRYFDEVDRALRAHGIRPASPIVGQQARDVLKVFNRVEGPVLYPRVMDTEFRLEAERNDFVLRGVVDVLAVGTNGNAEIWDYKGTDKPELSSDEMRDYVWQMSVYAELYKVKTGQYPERAVLYFVNELKTRAGDPPVTVRPVPAVHIVDFMRDGIGPDGVPNLVREALREFDATAADIITERHQRTWHVPDAGGVPDSKTCDICDIRWNCRAHPLGKYVTRVPTQ